MQFITQNLQILRAIILSLVIAVAFTVATTPSLYAQGDARGQVCESIGGCGSGQGKIQDVIKAIINILSAIGGIIAVIMIIVGGFKFLTAAGDSNSVSSARNTIIYSIVGLIVIAFAQIIVRFVLQNV